MKRKATLLLFILLALAGSGFANKILVKGYVKTGSAAVNHHAVNISTDSGSCHISHYVYTDSLGFYSDTLSCTTDIKSVVVSTADCNGTILSVTKLPTPNNYVEANFSICQAPVTPTNCKADYYFSVDSAHRKVAFGSSTSNTAAGDSIIKRSWDFGDGKSEENSFGPAHEYAQPGVYTVCFSIKTLKGCESRVCKEIRIPKPAESNKRDTLIVRGYVKNNTGGVKNRNVYISTDSSACTLKHQRTTDTSGYYADTLFCTSFIKSVKAQTENCDGKFIVIDKSRSTNSNVIEINFELCKPETVVHCVAAFKSEHINRVKMSFDSHASTTATGDSVINRKWSFGDAAYDTLNHINTTHEYAKPGTYTVCLQIKTVKGCESSYCTTIKIEDSIIRKDTLIVRGYVKNSNGGVKSRNVYISTDSSACTLKHQRTTDTSGYYADTLICTSYIKSVKAQTENCDGKFIVMDKSRSTNSNVIEINFELCKPETVVHCVAAFKGEHINRVKMSFDSHASTNATGDSVINRKWSFGDAAYDTLNHINTTHEYAKPGVYNVCLQIKTAKGCESSYCTTIKIEDSIIRKDTLIVRGYVKNSNGGVKSSNVYISTDSSACTLKHQRTTDTSGYYADTLICTSFIKSVKAQTENCDGKYIIIEKGRTTTSNVIEINFSLCIPPPPVTCHADFRVTPDSNSNKIKFNSNISSTLAGDSIIARRWEFGDGKIELNAVEISHDYPNAGIYIVCLTIKTAKGCESKECKQIKIERPEIRCIAQFTAERDGANKINFDSHLSFTSQGDSINQRKWFFGDGLQIITGNQVKIAKEYSRPGIYTACLYIKTAKNCEAKFCLPVSIQDTIRNSTNDEKIKIVSLYPSPAVTQLTVVVWSANDNVQAELGVFDVYGNKKSTSSRLLQKGDNIVVIPVSGLIAGPYVLKVTTPVGVKSRQFYKF
ncbi:MAG: hypothetical protein JWN76_97 [Chitinophagaceae bacterium]|nr:hypothetical protein [Chitinophagaceae bacterium]